MASFILLSEVANQATSTSNLVNDTNPPIKGVRALSGTSNAPSLAFLNDTDTGIYNVSPNNIGIVTGGVKRATVNSDGLSVNGTLTADKDIVASSNISSVNGNFSGDASVGNNFSTNTIRTSTGNINAPAYSFETDSNTGIFSPGIGFYGITTGGVARLVCDRDGNTDITGVAFNCGGYGSVYTPGASITYDRIGTGFRGNLEFNVQNAQTTTGPLLNAMTIEYTGVEEEVGEQVRGKSSAGRIRRAKKRR
eukprot:gene10910-17029_t